MNTELGGGVGRSLIPSQTLLTLPFRPTDSWPARGSFPGGQRSHSLLSVSEFEKGLRKWE